jgi:hypothetical protein
VHASSFRKTRTIPIAILRQKKEQQRDRGKPLLNWETVNRETGELATAANL